MYKHLLKYLILFFIFSLASVGSYAQLSIEPNSNSFNSYDGIISFSIYNTSNEAASVMIRIDITEKVQGNVITILQKDAQLQPGQNLYRSFHHQSAIQFYQTAVSHYLKNNDRLGEGEYTVCYSVKSKKAGISDVKHCLPFTIVGSTPLLLITPFNKQEICDTRPVFQWQNPSPLSLDAKIRFVLVEIEEGQNENQAVNRNMPLVHVMDAAGNILPLPSYVEQLKEGSRYAWQITVYNEQGVIKKSEIWVFKINCKNPVNEDKVHDTYRQLKPVLDGNYYLVLDKICFSFNNTYTVEKLDYEIVEITTNKPIKYYPQVVVQTGLNRVEIHVDDCQGLKRGKQYILRAKNINSTLLQMRFLYQ